MKINYALRGSWCLIEESKGSKNHLVDTKQHNLRLILVAFDVIKFQAFDNP